MKPTYPAYTRTPSQPMRAVRTLIACCLAAWAGLAWSVPSTRAETVHPLAVELSFDRPINAGEAPVGLRPIEGEPLVAESPVVSQLQRKRRTKIVRVQLKQISHDRRVVGFWNFF